MNNVNLIYTNLRHTFYRGEKACLIFDIMNFKPYNLEGLSLNLKIADIFCENIEIAVLSSFKQNLTFYFDTKAYKSGDYNLELNLYQNDEIVANEKFSITIVPPQEKGGVALWHWPATVHYNALELNFESAKKQLELLANLGYTWAQFRANWALNNPNEAIKLIEYAMKLNIQLGILVENSNGGVFKIDRDTKEDEKLIAYNGNDTNLANGLHPNILRRNELLIERLMMQFRDFPACSTVFMNSEIEDKLKLPYDANSKKIHEEKLGFSLDNVKRLDCIFSDALSEGNFVLKGVINDNDFDYLYSKYYFKYGDGFVRTNKVMGDAVRRYRDDITVITDPFRNCSVFGRFSGTSVVSSWTYTNPDPKATLFIESLNRAATSENQEVIHTVTLWNYAGSLMPSGDNRFSRTETLRMGPDRYKECAWINFARSPMAIGTYFGSYIEPTFKGGDELIYSPETEDAIKEFSQKVMQPFGKLARKSKKTKRRIAVLDSFSSKVYAVSPKPYNHYPNYRIYNFYIILNMAHLDADVIFDESFEDKDFLQNYDMLVLPCCDTLTESIYNKIVEFSKRGGVVVADQYLRADIENVIKFDFDFEYRKRVNANANTFNSDFDVKDDTNFRNSWNKVKAKGITALEDQNILESYAKELRDGLDSKFLRDFDCSSPKLLLTQREYNSVDYLFVVNDNRTWGDRLKKWKSMLEKGVDQNAMITIRDKGFKPVVYELLSHKKIEVKKVDDFYQLELTVEGASGAILAIYPEELSEMKITIPKLERGKSSKIAIDFSTKVGLQPLEVKFKSPSGDVADYGRYYLAENGICEIEITPAINDEKGQWSIEVLNLTTSEIKEVKYTL